MYGTSNQLTERLMNAANGSANTATRDANRRDANTAMSLSTRSAGMSVDPHIEEAWHRSREMTLENQPNTTIRNVGGYMAENMSRSRQYTEPRSTPTVNGEIGRVVGVATANMAGYNSNRSAYIQPNNSGYGYVGRADNELTPPTYEFQARGMAERFPRTSYNMSDYSRPSFHGLG